MIGVRPSLGYRMLYGYVRWMYTAAYSRRFEVRGAGRVPRTGPVILVTTHQNNLADACSVLFAAPRFPVFVARADYFRQPLAARAMRFMRVLPMYRADHGRRAIETGLPVTMRQLADHLRAGGACVIMAEGSSVPTRTVRRLKKSWARLYLDALPDAPGLSVVPVAIEYSDWRRWGPDVRVTFGEPLTFAPAPPGEVPRQLGAMNDHLHAALADLVDGDDAIATWHETVTDRRRGKDAAWRVAGLPALALVWALFWPVLILTRWAVRRHPRADFRSTLEIALVALGVPVWALGLGIAAWAAFGPIAAGAGTLVLPLVLWAAARGHIAWTRRYRSG